jgi:hypothetical protein
MSRIGANGRQNPYPGVAPREAATIEIPLTGAALAFEMEFAGLAEGRTRRTQ